MTMNKKLSNSISMIRTIVGLSVVSATLMSSPTMVHVEGLQPSGRRPGPSSSGNHPMSKPLPSSSSSSSLSSSQLLSTTSTMSSIPRRPRTKRRNEEDVHLHRHNQRRPFVSSSSSSSSELASTAFLAVTDPTTKKRRIIQNNGNKKKNRKQNRVSEDRQRLYNLSQQQRNEHPLLSLNLNLDSLAQIGAADRAQEILQRIDALYSEGYYEVSPDVVSYNSVLKAWKEDENPTKAMELLDEMIAHQKQQQRRQAPATNTINDVGSTSTVTTNYGKVVPPPVAFDVISCNTVLAAFAQHGRYNETLDLLHKMQQPNNHYPAPDTISYNSCIYALARSDVATNSVSAAHEAERILQTMVDDPNVEPDTLSYNSVLYAWLRASDPRSGYEVESRMEAAEHADELLQTMETIADRNNNSNNSGDGKPNSRDHDVEPDQYSYTTVMQAFAKAEQPDKARMVLERMIGRGIQPNRHACTALMSAWSKSGQVEEAQRMLYQLMDEYELTGHVEHKPDTAAFSCVIDGYAKISSPDRPEAAVYALNLLDEMKDWAGNKYGDDTFQPNARTYTSVMTALAKSGTWDACDQVLDLLQELEDTFDGGVTVMSETPSAHSDDSLPSATKSTNDHRDSDSSIARPTNIHYNALLLAYARSSRDDRVRLSSNLIRQMEHHPRPDCRPDIISYNTLLLACANIYEDEMKQEAFRTALDTFRTLARAAKERTGNQNKRSGDRQNVAAATSTSFNHFLKTTRRCVVASEQRLSVLSKTLKLCCDMAMLNHLIVNQVQLACTSRNEWESVCGELVDYIPWKADFKHSCRNVPKKFIINARR